MDDRVSRTRISVHAGRSQSGRAEHGGPRPHRQTRNGCRSLPTWSPISNWAAWRHRWRSIAPRRRASASRPQTIDNTLYDAFGQRQINTLYTQLNQYHVILETDPKFQLDPQKLHDIYIQSSSTSSAPPRRHRIPRVRRQEPEPVRRQSAGNALLTASSTRGFRRPHRRPRRCLRQRSHDNGASSVNSTSALSSSTATANATVLSSQQIHRHLFQRARPRERNFAGIGDASSASGNTGGGGSGGSRRAASAQTPVPLSAFTHIADAKRGALDQPSGTVSGCHRSRSISATVFARAGARCHRTR